MPSPFLTPGVNAGADTLALLHLRRDQIMPTILRTYDDQNEGYSEGKVSNTRFGSFPHSTMIGQPWGSQIAASKVDTGSRGRKATKRKADDLDESTPGADEETAASFKQPVTASSGFLHMTYPTPESWTLSLPHRTQVVYTPDYSYILHRLRARPGCTVIEAGAGSGSFTHASVRAVFNGYPGGEPATKKQRLGKVCSFEFHEQRALRVREEITDHGLDGLVEVTHRDVYEDGFLLGDPKTGRSPQASAIFLDLPAPWLALKHLVRNPESGESPLDPNSTVYLCTFSPCLEQAERTIRTMRKLSWLNISMVEVQHNRIDVKRERVGLDAEGVRGATVFPRTVDEAVNKLRTDEQRAKRFRLAHMDGEEQFAAAKDDEKEKAAAAAAAQGPPVPVYNMGRLTHRSEPELRTHTSYLVFAILPRDWTEEDEQRCRQKWLSDIAELPEGQSGKSNKQMKREFKALRIKEEQEKKAQAKQDAGVEPAANPETKEL
ncbi:tRNA (adenine(58)-N(1))-methyltransferase catalytic subunit trm61 [Penicillium argentinense]|uniref:tRNA (adenine(58)-N(1))-methyltransferase catalytic subunit TRM61 n=1 Tax=Penicillium argentinense TaxID=1131581 RepID=A0A9W9KB13_9EURO|nr:tRNA (adenine(58)-N(1))-methyltransferase catalytic subunit trm61 [Penicillium argentinense]KAJ5099553.1 tRNA (adenine(58)-N(1))-methyltransferase catalytic subunit trm61 [Penicillium argentinense]